LTYRCHKPTVRSVDYEIETFLDEGLNLFVPVVRGEGRPQKVMIAPEPDVGVGATAEALESEFKAIKGTDLLVPAREVFLAFGGDLTFDVTMIIGFDGTSSPLLEVRHALRPDVGRPVTATSIRATRIDELVKKAISENRTAYRKTSATTMMMVSSEERESIYLAAMRGALGETRRRISNDQLQTVANVYRMAINDRKNPTEAVEKAMGLPNRNMAKKWVQKSRAAGFLPPALGERRGGAA